MNGLSLAEGARKLRASISTLTLAKGSENLLGSCLTFVPKPTYYLLGFQRLAAPADGSAEFSDTTVVDNRAQQLRGGDADPVCKTLVTHDAAHVVGSEKNARGPTVLAPQA